MSAEFVLSQHAAWRIARRKNDLALMRIDPDKRDPNLSHALLPIAEYGDRVLRAVYNHASVPWLVVTVHFDRNARRRL